MEDDFADQGPGFFVPMRFAGLARHVVDQGIGERGGLLGDIQAGRIETGQRIEPSRWKACRKTAMNVTKTASRFNAIRMGFLGLRPSALPSGSASHTSANITRKVTIRMPKTYLPALASPPCSRPRARPRIIRSMARPCRGKPPMTWRNLPAFRAAHWRPGRAVGRTIAGNLAAVTCVLDRRGGHDREPSARAVCWRSEARGAKIVLVGDHEQLQAIGAGAPFRAIAEEIGHAEIRRQRVDWQ